MDALFERVEFEKIKGEELRAILLKASYDLEQAGLNTAAMEFRIRAALLVNSRNYVLQTRLSYYTIEEYEKCNDCLNYQTLLRLYAWKKENEKNETL